MFNADLLTCCVYTIQIWYDFLLDAIITFVRQIWTLSAPTHEWMNRNTGPGRQWKSKNIYRKHISKRGERNTTPKRRSVSRTKLNRSSRIYWRNCDMLLIQWSFIRNSCLYSEMVCDCITCGELKSIVFVTYTFHIYRLKCGVCAVHRNSTKNTWTEFHIRDQNFQYNLLFHLG